MQSHCLGELIKINLAHILSDYYQLKGFILHYEENWNTALGCSTLSNVGTLNIHNLSNKTANLKFAGSNFIGYTVNSDKKIKGNVKSNSIKNNKTTTGYWWLLRGFEFLWWKHG